MIVGLNPNCRQEVKRWPHFAELADRLELEGHAVWFAGIPRMQCSSNAMGTYFSANLKTLMMLMRKEFDIFVSVNSPLLQVAIAMRITTIALIGGIPARMVVPFNNPLVRYAEDPGLHSHSRELRMGEISVAWVLELIRLASLAMERQ